MKVKETFVSFIGQINVGRMAFFIDTDKSGVETEVDTLINQAKHFPRVVLLNDPINQKEETNKFVKKLVNINPHVLIEVNTYGLSRPQGLNTYKNIVYNVIVQLKNTGKTQRERYNKSVLEWFNEAEANFLFYIETEDCIDEVNLIVTDIGIKRHKVFLAVEGESTKEMLELVMNGAKTYNYNFSIDYRRTLWPDVGRF